MFPRFYNTLPPSDSGFVQQESITYFPFYGYTSSPVFPLSPLSQHPQLPYSYSLLQIPVRLPGYQPSNSLLSPQSPPSSSLYPFVSAPVAYASYPFSPSSGTSLLSQSSINSSPSRKSKFCLPRATTSTLNPKLADILSDHTPQILTYCLVEEEKNCDKMLIELIAETYNTGDFCFTNIENGIYSNNPWNMGETFKEYFLRKEKQLTKILEMIDANSIDVIFLQEVDFLYLEEKYELTEEQTKHIIDLRTKFLNELGPKGLRLHFSALSDKQQPLALIYRISKLKYRESYGVLEESSGARRYRGYAWIMNIVGSSRSIALVNHHLNFTEKNYSQSINALMQSFIDENIAFLGAGDMNHPCGTKDDEITHLFTPGIFGGNGSTNIQSLNGELSLRDDKGRDKHIDGFLAAPNKECKVIIQFKVCNIFVKEDLGIVIRDIPDVHNKYWSSDLGKPCVPYEGTPAKKADEKQVQKNTLNSSLFLEDKPFEKSEEKTNRPLESITAGPTAPSKINKLNPLPIARESKLKPGLMEVLSDHAPQFIKYGLLQGRKRSIMRLNVVTLNTLSFCDPNKNGEGPNNPWNIGETFENYLLRKEKQINEIFYLNLETKIDVMFLQEFDFLHLEKQYILSEEQKEKLLKRRADFIKRLKADDFSLIFTELSDKQKPLATIYRTSLFLHQESLGVLDEKHGLKRSQGLASIMYHIASKQRIVLVNLDLNPVENNSSINRLMQMFIDEDIAFLGGGDGTAKIDNFFTSHNNEREATKIHALNGALSIYEGQDHTQCVSGFLAAPNQTSYVSIMVIKKSLFYLNENLKITRRSNKVTTFYLHSTVGVPYTKIPKGIPLYENPKVSASSFLNDSSYAEKKKKPDMSSNKSIPPKTENQLRKK